MPKEQPVWNSELWQQSLVAAIRFNFSLLKFTFTFPNTKDIISYPFPRTSFLENSSHWCEWDLQSLYSLGNFFSLYFWGFSLGNFQVNKKTTKFSHLTLDTFSQANTWLERHAPHMSLTCVYIWIVIWHSLENYTWKLEWS